MVENSPPVFLLLEILAGILGLVAVVVGFRLRAVAPSPWFTLIAGLPALVMLGLFYSLAIHMHRALGGWPASTGEDGFPARLITHAEIATGYFAILLLISAVVLPLAFVLSALIRRWRDGIFYLGVYLLSYMVCFGAMLLAPSQFLFWWWD